MKIVTLLGSPRTNGNSATIAKRLVETAQDLGAQNQTFVLNKLVFSGCQACMVCKTKLDYCVLKDDLTKILDAVQDADALVLASPVYFADISAQMKMFIDRTYSYYVPDFMTNPKPSRLSSGKKMVFIMTQGEPDETMYKDIYPKYDFFFQVLGFKNTELIRACGVDELKDIQQREEILTLAEQTAHKIMNSAG